MNLKKIKVLSVFGIFIVSFLAHFIYEWFPSDLFAIFFPVNESIWEHMKMIFTSIMIWKVIEYLLIKHWNILYHNFVFANFISAIFQIVIYLAIYLPLFFKFGEKIFVSISLLFIVICIGEYISYQLMKKNKIKYFDFISLIMIIITYVIFGYLTYFPPRNFLFFDSKNEKYGKNIYLIDN